MHSCHSTLFRLIYSNFLPKKRARIPTGTRGFLGTQTTASPKVFRFFRGWKRAALCRITIVANRRTGYWIIQRVCFASSFWPTRTQKGCLMYYIILQIFQFAGWFRFFAMISSDVEVLEVYRINLFPAMIIIRISR